MDTTEDFAGFQTPVSLGRQATNCLALDPAKLLGFRIVANGSSIAVLCSPKIGVLDDSQNYYSEEGDRADDNTLRGTAEERVRRAIDKRLRQLIRKRLEDRRKKTKEAAAQLAVACNDLAVDLGLAGLAFGAAGTLIGLIAPKNQYTATIVAAAQLEGAVLGAYSYVSWWIGNRYQELANDPPRTDFGRVDSIKAIEATPPKKSGASVRRLYSLLLLLINEAAAIDALRLSLERLDGAIAAAGKGGLQSKANAIHRQALGGANAAHAARVQILGQIRLAPSLNRDWGSFTKKLGQSGHPVTSKGKLRAAINSRLDGGAKFLKKNKLLRNHSDANPAALRRVIRIALEKNPRPRLPRRLVSNRYLKSRANRIHDLELTLKRVAEIATELT